MKQVHRPVRTVEQRIQQFSGEGPSTIATAFLHTAARFLEQQPPANPLETRAFAAFEHLSPNGYRALREAVAAYRKLSTKTWNQLFVNELSPTIDHAISPKQLRVCLSRDFTRRTRKYLFGDARATERPGLPRPLKGIDPKDIDFTPAITRINGLRTSAYVPLSEGDLQPEEIQHQSALDPTTGNLVSTVQTNNCPGNSMFGVCLRVQEVLPGDSVTLHGYNFFNLDARVRLTLNPQSQPTREVQGFVVGDITTPISEIVNGEPVTIADGRIDDQLLFVIPDDLASGIYAIAVVVPNNTGCGSPPAEEYSSRGWQYIRVLPPPTATYQLTAERLKCADDTSWEWGSDELGIKFIPLPLRFDAENDEPADLPPVRFENLDSGDERPINLCLFSGGGIGALSVVVTGWEIDSEQAFQEALNGMMVEFGDAFVEYLKSSWHVLMEALNGVGAGLAAALGGTAAGAIAGAIGAAVVAAVGLIYALWAAADLVIADPIAVTALRFDELTSPNYPLPPASLQTGPEGIEVSVIPWSKSYDYLERRSYNSADEESVYQIYYRYTRLT